MLFEPLLQSLQAVNERIAGLDVPTVAVDGYHAAKEIVRYLVGLGHRNWVISQVQMTGLRQLQTGSKGFMTFLRNLT